MTYLIKYWEQSSTTIIQACALFGIYFCFYMQTLMKLKTVCLIMLINVEGELYFSGIFPPVQDIVFEGAGLFLYSKLSLSLIEMTQFRQTLLSAYNNNIKFVVFKRREVVLVYLFMETSRANSRTSEETGSSVCSANELNFRFRVTEVNPNRDEVNTPRRRQNNFSFPE